MSTSSAQTASRVRSSSPYRGQDGRWYIALEKVGPEPIRTRRFLSARTRRGVLAQLDEWRHDRSMPGPPPPRIGAVRRRPLRAARVSTAVLCVGGLLGAGLVVDHSAILSSHNAKRSKRSTRAGRGPAVENLLGTPQIVHFLATRTGQVTMALYNVDTNRTYLYDPGLIAQTGSTVKVAILATLIRQHQTSGTPLDPTSVQLATEMIEHSNDDAATALWNQIGGGPAVASYDAAAGLTNTTVGTKGFWGETTTTAADQVRMMRTVAYPNPVLDAASQGFALNLMENLEHDQRWGVAAGVPSGVTVALKDGWVPLVNYYNWQVNSVGWVDGDGRNYVLAVLTDDNGPGDGAEQYGIDTIQGVAPIVWNELAPPARSVPSIGQTQRP